MALRIGMDLVAVANVRDAVASHEDRYLRRIYTDGELNDCRCAGDVDCTRLAARFAGKEAVLKALRPNGEAIPWNAIDIRNGNGGAPEVRLTGAAAALAARERVGTIELSLTHEEGVAAAVAIATPRTEETI